MTGPPSGTSLASAPERLAVYQLALAESRAAFDELMEEPEKIRRNVGALLGFAAIAVTIFGVTPSASTGWLSGVVGAIAGLAVTGLAVCAAVVMAPRKVIPSMKADLIVEWGDDGDSEERAVKSLAKGIEDSYRKNQAFVRAMFKWQFAATICFGLAVITLAACTLGA